MMQRVLNGDIVEHAKPGEVYLAGAKLWNRIPDFTYDAPSLSWALGQNTLSLGLMGLWLAAAVAFATTAARSATVDWRMFSRILRHEWRLLTADGSLWLVIGIVAVAIAYGAFNGVRWVRFQDAAIAETAHEERERFAAQDATIARVNAGELKLSPFADPRNPQTAGSRRGHRWRPSPSVRAICCRTISRSPPTPDRT
jgi:hypothetical protein